MNARTPLHVLVSILILFFSFGLASELPAHPVNGVASQQDDSNVKTANESWLQFVERLQSNGVITTEQLESWKDGQEITVSRTVNVTRTRSETRSRHVPVERKRTVTNEQGEEVEETYTENVVQQYQVSVPYSEQVVQRFKFPVKGTRDESDTYNEIQTPKTINQTQPSKMGLNLREKTVKTSTETWPAYLKRMNEIGLIGLNEIDAWDQGQEIKIKKQFPMTRLRSETRTRSIPVTRQRGEESYTENVTQNYTVSVPYTEMQEVTLKIPRKGSVAPSATNHGIMFAGEESVSPELRKLSTHRPGQDGALYDRLENLSELKLQKIDDGDLKGVEIRTSSGKLVRRFTDFNNDGKIDNWIYYRNGKETYRDLDLDFDGKPEQCQIVQGDQIRYGIDEDQDGKIDQWKMGKRGEK